MEKYIKCLKCKAMVKINHNLPLEHDDNKYCSRDCSLVEYVETFRKKGYEICYTHKPWLNNEIGRNGYFGTQCFACHALNGIEKVNGKTRIKIGRWLAVFNNKSVAVWVYKDGKLFTRWTYGTMDVPLPTELIEGALKEVIAGYKEFNNE